MNEDQFKGYWKEMKGKVREKWGKLTNDDLDVIQGRGEQLIGKLQQRYGIEKAEAERQYREFLKTMKEPEASEHLEEDAA